MDATKQIAGLAKKGGALVGGQMAATIATEQGLNMAGDIAAEGTTVRKAGRIALPMLIGLVGLSFSKKDLVQMASYGAIAAGTQAAANTLLGTSRPAFYPGEVREQLAGYTDADYYELPPAGGYAMLPAAGGFAPAATETVQLVEVDQLG